MQTDVFRPNVATRYSLCDQIAKNYTKTTADLSSTRLGLLICPLNQLLNLWWKDLIIWDILILPWLYGLIGCKYWIEQFHIIIHYHNFPFVHLVRARAPVAMLCAASTKLPRDDLCSAPPAITHRAAWSLGWFHWAMKPMRVMFLTPNVSHTAVRESPGVMQGPYTWTGREP